MKYGYEIEAHIHDKELLAKYLQEFGSSTRTKFGCDGAGISAIEIRSQPESTIGLLLLDLLGSMSYIREYKPDYRSFICIKKNRKRFYITHSVHLSLDSEYKMNFWKLRWFFYVIYPLWLLKKNRSSFARFLLRKIIYPEIFRLHKERLELRFLSSEYPVSSINFFADYFELE